MLGLGEMNLLGEFVDDYTIKCVDVFAMPQSGTGVSVEAVDPVFQQQMLEMLKQTNRFVCVCVCVGARAQCCATANSLNANTHTHTHTHTHASTTTTSSQARNGCWLVSQSSRLWLLVVGR